jgi:hypothetical protein
MTTSLPLVLLVGEQLTISSSAVTVTTALFADSSTPSKALNVYKGIFTHLSGGKIYHHEKWGARTISRGGGETVSIAAIAAVSNSGANGEIEQSVGDKWEVTGLDALKVWEAILDSGASDATINVALYGRAD